MSGLRLNPLFRQVRWQRIKGVADEIWPYLRPVRREVVLALLCSIGGF